MQMHGWIEIAEDGTKRVVRTELKPPQPPENVKRLADGSLSVLPIVYENAPLESWQHSGVIEEEFTRDSIIRRKSAVDIPLDEFKQKLLRDVREEAGRRILAIAPDYRQRNLTARAAEIALYETRPWSPEILEEVTAGQAVWDKIKLIRRASDVAEEDILAANTHEEAASIVPFWPE